MTSLSSDTPTTHLSAYLKVFKVCSEQLNPGEIVAIIQVLALGPTKESLRTCQTSLNNQFLIIN